MTTAELERLLETALHEADAASVDVAAGRGRLLRRQEVRRGNVRRLAVAAVAASALLATAVAAVVLGVRGGERETPPVRPPHVVTFSPSGLPVGLLKGSYRVSGELGVALLLVRADGSGEFAAGAGHFAPGGGGGFDVTIRADGPGRAALVYDDPVRTEPDVVNLSFIVHVHSVTIEKITTPGNGLLTKVNARAITGSTLQILPAPAGGLGNGGSAI